MAGETQTPSDEAKKAHRMVMMSLEDYYDEKAKRYKPEWSDARIAKDTGASESHVAETREKYFGPLGEPVELTELRADLRRFVDDARATMATLDRTAESLKARLVRICEKNGWSTE